MRSEHWWTRWYFSLAHLACICSRTRADVPAPFELLAGDTLVLCFIIISLMKFIFCGRICSRTRADDPAAFELLISGHDGIFH